MTAEHIRSPTPVGGPLLFTREAHVKLQDALDQILGEGRTAILAAHSGAAEALAAGLAAVDIVGCDGPAARALATFAARRLREKGPAIDASLALKTEIAIHRSTSATPAARTSQSRHATREAMAAYVSAS